MDIDRARLRRAMQKLIRQPNKHWPEDTLRSLGEILSVPMVIKPAISEKRLPADTELPGAAKYLRRIGLGSILLGVARLTPPSLFWWQMAFVWLGGLVFIVDIYFERWKQSVKWYAALVIILLEAGYSYANGVGSSSPLDIVALGSASDYPSGAVVSRLPWSPHFSQVDLAFLNNTASDYEDITVVIRPELPVLSIVQSDEDPVPITIGDAKWAPMKQELVGPSGKRRANQLILIASDSGYILHCEKLPAHAHVGVTIVTAVIPPFSTNSSNNHPEDGGIFDSDYVLRATSDPKDKTSTQTSRWFAHSKGLGTC